MKLLARIFSKPPDTLKGRFFTSIVFLILFGGLLSIFPLLIFIQHQREEEALRNLNEVLQMQSELVSDSLDELTRDINYLSEVPEASFQNKTSFYEKLELLGKNRNSFYDIFYADSSGNILFKTNKVSQIRQINVSDRVYFQKAKEWHSYATGVREIGKSELPSVIISSPITSEDGRFGGILGGVVLLDSLRYLVSDFAYGETGNVYLADKNGKILSASSSRFPVSLKNTAIFQDALDQRNRTEPYQNVTGVESIGQYRWINQDEWVLISEVSTAEIARPFYQTLLFMSIILLFIFFISFFMIRQLINHLSKPLDALLEGTAVLQGGHYAHRIDEQIMSESVKEFHELCRAYNEMADNLQVQHSLREQAEEEMRLVNEQLRRLSLSDGLTGIGNRRFFDDVLELLWKEAEYKKKPIALLLLDIDFFKQYNDRYGHIAGDKALRLVAEAVEQTAKQSGALAARYGGEELAVIVPPGSAADNYNLGEQLRLAVQQLAIPHADAPSGLMSVSIGTAAVQPLPGEKADLLIQQADKALYHSKKQGRAQTTSFASITP